MKVVHFNTFESGGGAAKATQTLHRSLLAKEIESHLCVYQKQSDDSSVIGLASPSLFRPRQRIIPRIMTVLLNLVYHPLEMWSLGEPGIKQFSIHPEAKNADILSLSWVSWFLGIRAIGRLLSSGKPVVWTLYDMWAFTGGCHYSGECDRYENSCGHCPQLGSASHQDISDWVWGRKKRSWKTDMLTVVCPSRWLADCARRSSLFHDVRIEVIPSGVDVSCYKPVPKEKARELLGLPVERKLILFIASKGVGNERKGGDLLEKALHALHDEYSGLPVDIVILGRRQPSTDLVRKYRIHSRSFYDTDLLVSLYSACDVLVVPSRADNLPLTVLESMACGTPCVAFNVGGMPEVIEHMKNGYLAKPFDVEDIAAGIYHILSGIDYGSISGNAVEKIQSGFTAEQEAKGYISLYRGLLSEGQPE